MDTPILFGLLPLCKGSDDEIKQSIPSWVRHLNALGLPSDRQNHILGFMSYFVEHRFPTITIKELEDLFMSKNLLEGTRAGTELLEKGHKEGKREELIHAIIKILTKRFESVLPSTRSLLESETDVTRLEEIFDACLDANSQEEIFQ